MSGFELVPLDSSEVVEGGWELAPIEPDRPSVLRNVALNNPATAIGEVAMNLGSQMVALPVAGLAGLVTEAGSVVGLTDKTGADVVHSVGDALTYQPRGELGQTAAQVVAYPFEKLHEAATWAGEKTLQATGSPGAATAVHTAVEGVLPMAAFPAARAGRAALREAESPKAMTARGLLNLHHEPSPAVLQRLMRLSEEEAVALFENWQAKKSGGGNAALGSDGNIRRMAADAEPLPQPEGQGLAQLRRPGRDDLSAMADQFPDVPEGRRPEAGAEPVAVAGAAGPRWELHPGERSLAEASAPDFAPEVLSPDTGWRAGHDNPGGRTGYRLAGDDLAPEIAGAEARPVGGGAVGTDAVSPRFEIPDARWTDFERAGMGEEARNSSADVARADTARRSEPTDAGIAPVADPVQDSLARAERTLSEQGSIAGFIDYYNRYVHDGNTVESFIRHPDGAHSLRVVDRHGTHTVRIPPDFLNQYFDALRDPAKVAEIEVPNRGEMVLGRSLREIDDATLSRLANMSAMAPAARVKVTREIRRREAEMARSEAGRGMPAVAEAVSEPVAEQVRIADKAVTEFDDAALMRIIERPSYGEAAKAKARAEIERRAAIANLPEATPETQAMAAEVQNGKWSPGANYAPFVDQMRAPKAEAGSVADLPAPIRREHIIKDFANVLGATVYEGRVRGKNRLGFFRRGNEETRIKNANDIEVAAHELAHLIDSRVPELSNAWRSDKALREELKSVSYDQKSVPEGFAESVRLWMTQPETLESRAPKVAAWLDDFAAKHEYGPAMKKAQEQMTGWFGQDALNRARSKIGTEKSLAEYFDRAFDKFRQSTVDDLHGIMQMERDLTGKLSPVGPYESARLSRASASIADGAVRFGHPVKNPDGSFKFAGKGLEEILQPVAKNLDDALLYFVGRSANELMAQGREHLFTRGEIDAMLRLKTPERAKAFEEYQAWNRGILDFAEAQGIINPETRRLWQRTQYLPFHRVDQPGGIKSKPGDWAGVQALTGGTTNLRDILGNMIGNAAMLLDKAVKNEARLKVADLADGTKSGKWMVKIEPGERPVKIGGDQVLDAMFKRYGIAADGEAPAFFQFMLRGQPPAGNNVVAVLRDGKPTWYEVGDPILYRALTAIDRPAQNWLVRMLGAPKRIGQASITATPDFWMANMARDTLMGAVMSRAGFWPILDSLQGMRLRMTNDQLYKDFIANGGGLSSIYLDEGALRSKLKRFYQRQGINYRTVLDAPEKLLNAIETLGDAFEMSTRLGEYRRAVERGEHPRHAAYLGREVSTDFAMRGDSKTLGFLYDTVMFLKAATVSWDRLARGATIDPNRGAIAAKTSAIAGMSAALYLLNRDDPRYADLPDWDKDSNWHIFVGDQHFRYPKIWEIGAVASMAERSTEKLMTEDPEGLGKDFARILGNTFHLNLMPQIIAPPYEQATNRNSFTGSPIETPGMEGVQSFLRAKPGTSETMKELGMATKDMPEWAQVNPARTEALLRGYFNTWGLYGLMLTDQTFFGDKLPEKRADELPVVRRFYANEPAKNTKFESEFYDLLTEARRLRGTLRELDELGLRQFADEKEQSPLAGEAKPLERAQKSLSAINRDMQAVRRDPALTPAEKRQKLDVLMVERNALLKGAVLESKKVQKEKENE
ncbi:MAG: hypothetical protein H3C26_15800 [Rhodocyclaceae bacterium]|nr:hypothetical protein [Rhodocyclaceae bacterium]